MQEVELPHNGWRPRLDQMRLWAALEQGCLRADEVAHRRWGKDEIALHYTAVAAHQKIGNYWHMLPEASQARKALWDAVNPRTGKRRIDEAFPHFLRQTTREQEMFIRFKCGSTWQVLGSDNYDSLVGSPPIGCVFSEWALARPDAWNYIRPILLENGGWALFIWTPRGRNHSTRAFVAREKDVWDRLHNPTGWFAEKTPASVTPVFTPEQLAKERQELIDEAGSVEEGDAKFQQEYMVNFDAAVPGSYYATELRELELRGGFVNDLYDPKLPVYTSWDLGIDDYTAIWFFQKHYGKYAFIDYFETSGVGLDSIKKYGFEQEGVDIEPADRWRKQYTYVQHLLPHDVEVRELGAGGRTRRQSMTLLGFRNIRTGVAQDPEERINAGRKLLKVSLFDPGRCEAGIDHLRQYKKRFNVQLGVYVGPLHNEHSHGADAFGEAAVNSSVRILKIDPKSPNPVGDRWFKGGRRSSAPKWKVA